MRKHSKSNRKGLQYSWKNNSMVSVFLAIVSPLIWQMELIFLLINIYLSEPYKGSLK